MFLNIGSPNFKFANFKISENKDSILENLKSGEPIYRDILIIKLATIILGETILKKHPDHKIGYPKIRGPNTKKNPDPKIASLKYR